MDETNAECKDQEYAFKAESILLIRAETLQVRVHLLFLSELFVTWRNYVMTRLRFLAGTSTIKERWMEFLKRRAFNVVVDQHKYMDLPMRAAAAMRLLAPRVSIKQCLRKWLYQVER